MPSINTPNLSGLLRMALPLSGAMASQAIINMVDTALVGNLGGLALASVSIGSYLVFLLVAIPIGFAIGMQSLISQYKDHADYSQWLWAGITLGLSISIFLTLMGEQFSHYAISLYVADDRISGVAQAYFDWRLIAIPGVALSLAARSYWASQYQPWQYSRLLIISHISNIPISYCLIYGFGPIQAMGAAGAGLGTCISIYLGLLLQLTMFPKDQIWQGSRHMLSALRLWPKMFRVALPSALQQLAFALHLAILLWIISSQGATALAASFAVLNLGLIILLPLQGIAQASSSLIAKNFTAADNQAWQWSKLAMFTGLVCGLLCWLLVSITQPLFLPLILVNREIILLASIAIPIYAFALIFDSLGQIATRSLVATQATKRAAAVNILSQWGLLLPISAWLVPVYGFIAIWIIQVIYRLLLGVGLWLYWAKHARQTSILNSL